ARCGAPTASRTTLWALEPRSERRHLVIAVVGTPATGHIALLLGLLAHLSDRRIAGHRGEKAVDVDRGKPLGKREVLLRHQMLVAEEHDAVLAEGAADLGKNLVGQCGCQIDAGNLGPDFARNRFDPDGVVARSSFV